MCVRVHVHMNRHEIVQFLCAVVVLFFRLLLLFFQIYLFYFMPISVFPACVCEHQISTWCPQRSDISVRFLGTRFVGSCVLLCGCWEQIPDLLEEQQEPLALNYLVSPIGLFLR